VREELNRKPRGLAMPRLPQADRQLRILMTAARKLQIDPTHAHGYVRPVNCTLNLRLSLLDAPLTSRAAVGF